MAAVADANGVGSILVKVQDELQRLKEQLTSASAPSVGTTSIVDLRGLQSAIDRTEKGIKAHAEQVLNAANNQVLTLPLVQKSSRMEIDSRDLPSNVQLKSRLPRASHTRHLVGGGLNLSPGQKVKQAWAGKLLRNPTNPVSRDFLKDKYGVALPSVDSGRSGQTGVKKVVTGSTVEPLAVLPKQNRVDAQLTPPPITEDDAKKGILSLIERGLIPPAAELSLSPSPVRNRQAMIHSPTAQHTRHCISDGTAVGANLTGVKMDPERASSPSKTPENQLRFRQRAETPSARERFIPGQTLSASSTAALTNRSSRLLTPVTFETPLLQPQPPHPTPASNLSGAQKIIIQHGVTVISSPEYKAFKLANALQWGSIVMILRQMEELLKAYCIPLAFVDGDKLVDLSIEYELEQKPSKEELLNCMINHKEIRRLTNTPGRRFKGQDGHHIAATVIQAQYRMFWERAKYLAYRKQKWAAGVIALNWLMQLRKRILRSQMKARRAAQLERFRRRATELRHNWSDVCKSRRVIVHIPSRGHSENVRDQLKHFNLMENLQIGRLCDIRDPLVDVIYVSPVELNDEMLQYYEKLMRMCEESSENKKEDTLQQQEAKRQPIEERFHFVVPEHLRSFEGHNMSLATLLMYSPLAIQRIKNLVAGRPGFIVPGLQSKHDDLAVADMLNLPCLSAEPDIAGPYSMKSGARRIFVSSQVEMPPCEFDIYSKQQFLSSLTKLVTNNLEIKRWLFKIDEEFDSRGIAFCDITDHLQCYNWALKESQRYGEKWNKKWAQEQALHRIAAELPKILEDHTVIVNKRVYPDWTSFFQVFKQGGVIEAAPPCQTSHVTSVTVNMMIDPTGEIKLVSTGDQVR